MKFEKKVKQIASVERDVDKVLRAARLRRYPISDERLDTILMYVFMMFMVFMSFAFLLILTWMRY